jgi:hypothetical protein
MSTISKNKLFIPVGDSEDTMDTGINLTASYLSGNTGKNPNYHFKFVSMFFIKALLLPGLGGELGKQGAVQER